MHTFNSWPYHTNVYNSALNGALSLPIDKFTWLPYWYWEIPKVR